MLFTVGFKKVHIRRIFNLSLILILILKSFVNTRPEWHLWWYRPYCSYVMHTKPVRHEINVAVFVCRIIKFSWKHVITKHRTLH